VRRLVVDASALVEVLLATERAPGIDAEIARSEVEVELHTPALCDVEVASALRRALLGGRLEEGRARLALRDLADLPMTRHGHQLLVARTLELRHNFSAYDATYVALAESLDAALVTADRRLASAVRSQLDLSVIG